MNSWWLIENCFTFFVFDIALILLFVVKDIARVSEGEPVVVFSQSTSLQPACGFLPQRFLDCWWQRMALGQGCVCSLPYVYDLYWSFPDPQLSLPVTHAYTRIHLPASLSSIVLDILPYWYFATLCLSSHCFSRLIFAKVYCRKCVLEIEMFSVTFFVSLPFFFCWIPIFIVFFTPWGNCSEVSKLCNEPNDEHYQNTKAKRYVLTFGRI